MRSLEKLKKFSEVILISDKMTPETKRLTKENKELLTKYFNDLKKYGSDLSALIPKVQKSSGIEQDFLCQETIVNYRPKIIRALASIKQLYPFSDTIEYVSELEDGLEEGEDYIDKDVFYNVVSSLEAVIGNLEIRLKDKLKK
jgi:hypothetical protein